MKWSAPKIWKGDCWIIGGGSSISEQFNISSDVVPETLDEFRNYGEHLKPIHEKRIIAVNLAAFFGDWIEVAYWGDSNVYTEYRNWFDNFSGLKVSSAGKFSDESFPNIKHLYKDNNVGITKDRTAISWCGKNSGSSAINLAYHLGATRIFLLGFDMYSNPKGRVHFHTGYPDRAKTPNLRRVKKGIPIPRKKPKNMNQRYKRQLSGFSKVKEDADKLSLKIYNVNPKSNVQEFPKISLKEALEM